jgi:4,5-DOPA dioxygenase extradiol
MSATKRQPAMFLAHGDPMNALRDNEFTRKLASMALALQERPRAILVVSAHWQARGALACSAAWPETIHDFGGFPDELYRVEYPAPGAPELAREAAALMAGALPGGARETTEWGLDHGAWTVLAHLFPRADIPVFQVAIDSGAGLAGALAAGRALAPLREEGVLFIGSGNIVHNLGAIRWGGEPYAWAGEFDGWVAARLNEADEEALCDIDRAGESARKACPTLEHYAPLLYALGAAGPGARPSYPYVGFEHGSLSMRCVLWDGDQPK